jgi:hypothetical protein
LRGGEILERTKENLEGVSYPVLLISLDCPFCPTAKNFWSRLADENGIDLPVKIAEKEEKLAEKYGVAGYPCLVCGPDQKYYGIHFSHKEAKAILTGNSTDA